MRCALRSSPLLLTALVAKAFGAESADGSGLPRLEPETGLLPINIQEFARREETNVAANHTCSEACGMLGGLCFSNRTSEPCERRRQLGEPTWACSCDIALGAASPLKPDLSSKLSESPFLMTHDSATGFISGYDLFDHAFGQAQAVGLKEQLDCGARSFDLRLVKTGGEIHFHHGETAILNWVSSQTLSGELPRLIEWAREHPSQFVVIVVGHCAEKGWIEYSSKPCSDEEFVKPFAAQGVAFETKCDKLRNMTLAEAMKASALRNGGHLLAIDIDCVETNWKSEVTSAEQVQPYVAETMKQMQGSGKLFQIQALMQQKFLIQRSYQLNKEVATWITDTHLLDGVNFLEINTICAYGMAISRSLGATVSSTDADSCMQICKKKCPACDNEQPREGQDAGGWLI